MLFKTKTIVKCCQKLHKGDISCTFFIGLNWNYIIKVAMKNCSVILENVIIKFFITQSRNSTQIWGYVTKINCNFHSSLTSKAKCGQQIEWLKIRVQSVWNPLFNTDKNFVSNMCFLSSLDLDPTKLVQYI